MDGWIKVYRKMLDNPIITKDSDYIAVWLYLLLNATHIKYDTLFKGKRITLMPGQLISGRKSVCTKMHIDENKVQRILKVLENEHQIEQQTSSQNRLISIINWNEYQQSEQQNKQQVNNDCTTSEQRVNTNKNIKNIKNERIYLFNLYKEKIEGKNFGTKLHIINECKNTKEYSNLSIEEQDKLFTELMQIE